VFCGQEEALLKELDVVSLVTYILRLRLNWPAFIQLWKAASEIMNRFLRHSPSKTQVSSLLEGFIIEKLHTPGTQVNEGTFYTLSLLLLLFIQDPGAKKHPAGRLDMDKVFRIVGDIFRSLGSWSNFDQFWESPDISEMMRSLFTDHAVMILDAMHTSHTSGNNTSETSENDIVYVSWLFVLREIKEPLDHDLTTRLEKLIFYDDTSILTYDLKWNVLDRLWKAADIIRHLLGDKGVEQLDKLETRVISATTQVSCSPSFGLLFRILQIIRERRAAKGHHYSSSNDEHVQDFVWKVICAKLDWKDYDRLWGLRHSKEVVEYLLKGREIGFLIKLQDNLAKSSLTQFTQMATLFQVLHIIRHQLDDNADLSGFDFSVVLKDERWRGQCEGRSWPVEIWETFAFYLSGSKRERCWWESAVAYINYATKTLKSRSQDSTLKEKYIELKGDFNGGMETISRDEKYEDY